MAVLEIKEVWKGREASADKKATRYTRAFWAKTDNPLDDAAVIGQHPDCPQYGQPHPNDPFAFCQSIQISNDPLSRTFWSVTAGYSTERELNQDPTLEPAEISWDPEEFQRPLVLDKNGDPVTNSAFDPYDPPYMIDDARQIVTVVKNVAAVPAWVLDYRNVVNDDAFTVDGISVAVGQGKIKGIKISPWKRQNNYSFRTVTIPINIDKKNGWKIKLVDMGMKEIKAGIKVPIILSNGTTAMVPHPLDGNGVALPGTSILLADLVTREHEGYDTKPFNVLPLS